MPRKKNNKFQQKKQCQIDDYDATDPDDYDHDHFDWKNDADPTGVPEPFVIDTWEHYLPFLEAEKLLQKKKTKQVVQGAEGFSSEYYEAKNEQVKTRAKKKERALKWKELEEKRALKRKEQEEEQRLTISLDEKKVSHVLGSLKNKVYKEIQGRKVNVKTSKCSPNSTFLWKYWTHMNHSDEIDKGINPMSYRENSYINQDAYKDAKLFEEFKRRQQNKSFRKMQDFRQRLPAHKHKKNILNIIAQNQVILLSGETGCGKTTQVPQFILDDYIESECGSLCRIVCTQPRRISAISVAERVAEERAIYCGEGSEVGYHVRLESNQPREVGSILYCTTGILLQRLQNDPCLSRTSHIIVDEVHERDLLSDFLLIILRDILQRRNDLKVILMSATLDSDVFSRYFGNCPQINIEGFTYPVEVFTLEDAITAVGYYPFDDKTKTKSRKPKKTAEELEEFDKFYSDNHRLREMYSSETLDTIRYWDEEEIDLQLVFELLKIIEYDQKEGAVLVFLPGWEEIKKLSNMLDQSPLFPSSNYSIIPLHSKLPTVNQKQVFNKPPEGVRKIVLATNIAETSITIDDVVYVIDCGKVKMKNFDSKHNISTLQPEWVAKSNVMQRRGRAGRTQPGTCYHLISKFRMSKLDAHQCPEMLRTRLEEIMLAIKLLKLGKIKPFLEKAMQPPDLATVDLSFDLLYKLRALDEKERLTPLGYHLARLPVDPQIGKMMIYGSIFSCINPILSIAASLSFKDPFSIPMGKASLVDTVRKSKAEGTQSDHLMLAHVLKEWEEAEYRRDGYQYCQDNFLSYNTLKMLIKLKHQFAQYLHGLHFLDSVNYKDSKHNINSDNEMLVKAVICAGLSPNVAKIQRKTLNKAQQRLKFITADGTPVDLHRKSVNEKEQNFSSMWLVYHLKIRSYKILLHDSTVVHSFPLLFFGGELKVFTHARGATVTVDDWIVFNCTKQTAFLIKELRSHLDDMLRFRFCDPGVTNWSSETKEGFLLQFIINLISSEYTPPEHFGTWQNSQGNSQLPLATS